MTNPDVDLSAAPELGTLSSQLLAEVRRMDSASWSRLVNTFGPIVYRWCRASGVPEADAPDIVQEVFAAVARGILGFEREKSQGSFRSWLATITRNKVRDFYRRQAKLLTGRGGTEALLQLQQVAEDLDSTICAENARTATVREVLELVESEFESTTWMAFWLATMEQKTAAEVAEITSLSVASVYQSKSRVLRRLRQRLAEIPQ